MILDKAAISKVDDVEYDIVDVPEWGEAAQVRIRNLFGDQRQRINDVVDKHPCINALVAAMGLVDSQNAQIYTEAEAIALFKKHPVVLNRIAVAILDLSNMTKASRDATEKKLQQTQTSDSGSGSPAGSTPDSA